jgi:hypothetical protein
MAVASMTTPAHRLVLPLTLACVGCRGGAATAGHDGATSGDPSATTASANDTDDDPGAPACAVEPRDPVRRLSAFEDARALDDQLGVTIDEARLPASSTSPTFATERDASTELGIVETGSVVHLRNVQLVVTTIEGDLPGCGLARAPKDCPLARRLGAWSGPVASAAHQGAEDGSPHAGPRQRKIVPAAPTATDPRVLGRRRR